MMYEVVFPASETKLGVGISLSPLPLDGGQLKFNEKIPDPDQLENSEVVPVKVPVAEPVATLGRLRV